MDERTIKNIILTAKLEYYQSRWILSKSISCYDKSNSRIWELHRTSRCRSSGVFLPKVELLFFVIKMWNNSAGWISENYVLILQSVISILVNGIDEYTYSILSYLILYNERRYASINQQIDGAIRFAWHLSSISERLAFNAYRISWVKFTNIKY